DRVRSRRLALVPRRRQARAAGGQPRARDHRSRSLKAAFYTLPQSRRETSCGGLRDASGRGAAAEQRLQYAQHLFLRAHDGDLLLARVAGADVDGIADACVVAFLVEAWVGFDLADVDDAVGVEIAAIGKFQPALHGRLRAQVASARRLVACTLPCKGGSRRRASSQARASSASRSNQACAEPSRNV